MVSGPLGNENVPFAHSAGLLTEGDVPGAALEHGDVVGAAQLAKCVIREPHNVLMNGKGSC